MVVFGPQKLPQIGRDLGKGLRTFKGVVDGKEEIPEEHPSADKTIEQDRNKAWFYYLVCM
jgi:Sec-independent protein translocase protein TatA